MRKKTDLRVIKTKRNLYQTLISLLKEKPFEEIKVSDICEASLINRSTFYAHYNDKYELFSAFIEDLKNELIHELSKNKSITNTKEYYIEMLKLFLDHIDTQKEIYSLIMINNKNSIMMDMVYDTLNNELSKKIELEPTSNIPSDIVVKFYLGAVFNVGTEWLRNKNKYSKQEIISYLEKLIPDNIENKQ